MDVRSLVAVVATSVALAACATDPEPSVTPTPTPSESPGEAAASPEASETPIAVVPAPTGAPAALVSWTDAPASEVAVPADVFVEGLSPDGQHLLVSGPDPDGRGCEEGPPRSLQLLDINTRELRPALDPSLGMNAVRRGPDGSVLLWAGCEGFVASAYLGTQAADGSFTELRELPLPESSGGYVDVTALSPAAGEAAVLAVRFRSAGGSDLVLLDETGAEQGAATRVEGDVYAVTDTAIGAFAIEFGGDDELPLAELRSGTLLPGFVDVATDVSRTQVWVSGDAGLAVVTADAAGAVTTTSWVSDPIGDQVLFGVPVVVGAGEVLSIRDVLDAQELVLVGPDGVIEVVDLFVSSVEGPFVSGDGNTLVYVREDPETYERTVVLRSRL